MLEVELSTLWLPFGHFALIARSGRTLLIGSSKRTEVRYV